MTTIRLRDLTAYVAVKPPVFVNARSITGYVLYDPAPPPPPVPPYLTDYKKPQEQLIHDLIAWSNPDFNTSYPVGTVTFGTPTSIQVDIRDYYKNDTQVVVTPKPGTGGRGSVVVKYRRINLSTLFRGKVANLNDYTAASTLPVATFQASFISAHGISLLDSDWPTNLTAISPDTVYTYALQPNGLCFTGSFSLKWTKGKRQMSDMVTDANRALPGRLYPGGNDFTTPGRKPVGEWQLYGLDASPAEATANMEAWASISPVTAGSIQTGVPELIAWLNANSGITNWSNSDSTVPGGLGGLTWYKYLLPSASIPEANVAYNRAIVIPAIAGSWFTGKLILHYNG